MVPKKSLGAARHPLPITSIWSARTEISKLSIIKQGVGSGIKTSANADATGLVVYPGESILIGRKVTSDTAGIVQTGIVPTSDVKSVFTQGYSTAASLPAPDSKS